MKRSSGLTPKQQLRARAKVFKILLSLGFQLDEKGEFYWRIVNRGNDYRVCVGFGVFNRLFQRRETGWMWQRAKLNEAPAFGYSGSCSLGAEWGTVERVIDNTLSEFWSAGIAHSSAYHQCRVTQVKEKLTAALTLVLDEL